MMRHCFYLTIALTVFLSCEKAAPATGGIPKDEPQGDTISSLYAINPTCVARVIGYTPAGESVPNPNNSMKRFGIASTDFGNMWDAGNGELWSIFGDNFDDRGGSWRSNAITVSTDRNLSDGLHYDNILRDSEGKVLEPIISRAKTGQYLDGSEHEITCIPTGGVAVPNNGSYRQYIHYMSIHKWATAGNDMWATNYSEIVYSDDFGKTFRRSGVKWGADSHFAQIAYMLQNDTLYMYGTAAGRLDDVHLARVHQDEVLDKSAYRYWDGASWSDSESDAAAVAGGTVSEMTVRYNSWSKRYIMMYLSANQRKLVYRDAALPQGEWSAEKIILNDGYGPSIHPWFCDSDDLYFVVSSVTSSDKVDYDTWHIHLYHATLTSDPEGFNMIWEGGFENEPNESINYKTLWNAPNANSSRDSHRGKIACKLHNGTQGTWKDACTQTVKVHKNTDYTLTAWAKSNIKGHTGAYLGARLPDGTICDDNPALDTESWTKITKTFNSADNTSIEVFFGTWGADGLYVLVDDIQLTPKQRLQ